MTTLSINFTLESKACNYVVIFLFLFDRGAHDWGWGSRMFSHTFRPLSSEIRPWNQSTWRYIRKLRDDILKVIIQLIKCWDTSIVCVFADSEFLLEGAVPDEISMVTFTSHILGFPSCTKESDTSSPTEWKNKCACMLMAECTYE